MRDEDGVAAGESKERSRLTRSQSDYQIVCWGGYKYGRLENNGKRLKWMKKGRDSKRR